MSAAGFGPSEKPEYLPLLSLGFHPMSLDELRKLCVDQFPLSGTRDTIMDGLEAVVRRLRADGIEGDLWVNGSFVTKKIDPEDVDVLLRLEATFADRVAQNQQQKDTIEWFKRDLTVDHRCDSYVFVEYPRGHELYSDGEWQRAYWIRQFGFSRGNDRKGIALLDL